MSSASWFNRFIISSSSDIFDLHTLAENGNIEKLKSKLSERPDRINEIDEGGFTPLHKSCKSSKLDCSLYLISIGGRLDIRSTPTTFKNGVVPIDLVKSEEVKRQLISAEADYKSNPFVLESTFASSSAASSSEVATSASTPTPPLLVSSSSSSSSSSASSSSSQESSITVSLSDTVSEIIPKIAWRDLVFGEALGQGAFGIVVVAKLHNRVNVAVKILSRTFIARARGSSREDEFDRACEVAKKEAALIVHAERRLKSDSIIHVIGIATGPLPKESVQKCVFYHEDEVAIGIVMRLEQGGSLDSLLHPVAATGIRRYMSVAEKTELLTSIARGVSDLHDIGLVHGDLKPANILLSHHLPPMLRICDFGLANIREVGDDTVDSTLFETSTRRGTPVYSAPELLALADDTSEKGVGALPLPPPAPAPAAGIAAAVAAVGGGSGVVVADVGGGGSVLRKNTTDTYAKVSRKTDMYAFAIMCWEIYSSTKPFERCRSQYELTLKVLNNERPPLDSIPPEVPRFIVEMIEKCWSANRSERLTSLECLTRLEHYSAVLSQDKFDIFFSHAWVNKNFLRHVKNLLCRMGYR